MLIFNVLTGIWLHPLGIFGASTDSKVKKPPVTLPILYAQDDTSAACLPDIVEVKCPYSDRNRTVETAAMTLFKGVLHRCVLINNIVSPNG